MPIMLISLVSNIDPYDVVEPTGVDTRVPIVWQRMIAQSRQLCQGRRRKTVKSVGSDGIESLSEVAAGKVCREWQQVKSVIGRTASNKSVSGMAAQKMTNEHQRDPTV